MGEFVFPPPNKRQVELFKDRHRYVAYGGARGGGKSWAVRIKAVLLCYKYPGIKVMIIRKTYPELQENHILPLCELLNTNAEDKNDRLAQYNDSKKHIIFPKVKGHGYKRSRILFRYCDKEKDVLRFQGTEVDVLFVDEATHQSEEKITKLKACVRGVNEFPKRTYYTCNPGGEGHGWVKRLFIDRHFNEAENPEDYSFIKALVTDNKALMEADPEYVKQLQALPPKLREAWLHGNWDIFEGQFFEDFRIEPDVMAAHEHGCDEEREVLKTQGRWCHVIPALDLSRPEFAGWKVYRSYDFGYGKPFSCAWWAMNYDGVLYRILELYGCRKDSPNEGVRWTPDQQFKEIARIEREHPWLKGRHIEGIADPSIWDSSRGESIADVAMHYGVYFTPGDNNRIPGWMQCHYRLQFDENGYARMYVFDNCAAFIRTIPTLVHDEHRPEDLDTTLEDHVADDWRYMCMSRPIKPILPKKVEPVFFDPLNMFNKK